MPAAVPDREPGEVFHYSNPGYALVQLLIEDVTDQPFASWVSSRVLGPLGMRRGSFEFDPDDARPHRRAGVRLPDAVPNHLASGALRSSVRDLAELALGVMSDRELLPAPLLSQMVTVTPAAKGAFMIRNGGYGLGIATGKLPGGRRFVANQGSRAGYRSLLVCLPDVGDAIVATTNSDNGNPLLLHVALKWLLRGGRLRGAHS